MSHSLPLSLPHSPHSPHPPPPRLSPLSFAVFPAFIALFTILCRRLYISLSYSYCTRVQYLSSCPISFQPSHFLPLSPPIRVRAKRAPSQLSAHLPLTPTKKGALAPDQICYNPSSSNVYFLSTSIFLYIVFFLKYGKSMSSYLVLLGSFSSQSYLFTLMKMN